MWNFNSWNVELELSSFSNSSNTKTRDANVKEANFSNGALKTEEEINSYSLNETLNPIERAEYILKNGVSLQKEYVYSSLVTLIKDDAEGMVNTIIPLILKNIKDENTSLQKIFGESLLKIIKEKLLDETILGQFIPLIKEFLQSAKKKEDEFVDLWITILNEMIPALPEDIITNQLVSEMKSNIDLSKPIEFREMCARIMGTLSGYVDATTLEIILFPKIVALCQDTLYEIRKYMSEQLNQIFKNLKLESFLKQLMTEYIELIMDEEEIVRNTALCNVVDIIPDIAKRLNIDIIYPTLKTIICEQSSKYSESIKEKIGLIIWNIKDYVCTDELQIFIKYFISVATTQNEKDCIDYIYNLPCITFISEQLNYEKSKMCEIINFYCQNKSNLVRIKVSKCFHEFATLYNKTSYKNLSSAFITLLKDNDIKVLETIFQNMSIILGNFSKDPSAKFNDIAKEIVNAYHRCKTIAPLNWRAQKYVVKNFECFPNIFSMDIINTHITPLIFDQLLDKSVVRPIKQIFCKAICIFLKNSKKIEHRERIHAFLKEMKQSQDYHIRYLFLVICHNAIGIFSSRYFCEYFLYYVIDLYRDPIPNIRIFLCELLMPIRHCLFLFNDSTIIQKFNIITNSLIIRNSDDVDLNKTNLIINDVLNYPELQRNNKYVLVKPLPKDSSNLTINFFLNNEKSPSKRNSLNYNNSNKNSVKAKANSNRKDSCVIKVTTKEPSELSMSITGSNKPANTFKKFVLPEDSIDSYKIMLYNEIFKTMDEINYENLISEDQLKEKEESHLFRITSEQVKRNKNNLLDHFKNNVNQFTRTSNNKAPVKKSIENLSKNESTVSSYKNNGSNTTISSNKQKLSNNSKSSSLKTDINNSSQKYKKLGDEKITQKPKISSNTNSGKMPTTSARKKTEKEDLNKRITTSKTNLHSDTTKKKNNSNEITKKSINKSTKEKKDNEKENILNGSNKRKESITNTANTAKRKESISSNVNEDSILEIDVLDLSDVNDMENHTIFSNDNTHRKSSINSDSNNSNFLSPSKSSSIWSSSSSTTMRSSNLSVASDKSNSTKKSSTSTARSGSPASILSTSSAVSASSAMSESSSVSRSSAFSASSATSTSSALSASSAVSASSTASNGKSIIKKKINTSNSISTPKPKISFDIKNSTSNLTNSTNKNSSNSINTKSNKASNIKPSPLKSSTNKLSTTKASNSSTVKVLSNKTIASKVNKNISNSTVSLTKKKTATKTSVTSSVNNTNRKKIISKN